MCPTRRFSQGPKRRHHDDALEFLMLQIDKNLLLHGLRLRKAAFYVKGISSQHAVSRQDAIPDHEI